VLWNWRYDPTVRGLLECSKGWNGGGSCMYCWEGPILATLLSSVADTDSMHPYYSVPNPWHFVTHPDFSLFGSGFQDANKT
jgi:hypothetical protein